MSIEGMQIFSNSFLFSHKCLFIRVLQEYLGKALNYLPQ